VEGPAVPDLRLRISPNLLQNSNLPGMIKLVLRNSVKHVIKIVSLAGNAIGETRVAQSGNGFHQCIVRAPGFRYGSTP
jgi:hypothetical protein